MDQPVRILVVDEDSHTRQLLTAAFAEHGTQEVVAARSLEEALAKLATSEFTLVICDLMLPGLPGLDVIKKLRTLHSNKPLLILSAEQTAETVAGALELGADDYLQKPVDLRELRRAIAVLVNRLFGRPSASGRFLAFNPNAASVPPAAQSSASVRSIAEGTFVELTAATDPLQAERFQRFAERLLAASLTEKERHHLHLALEELLRNAMEWGNRHDRSKQLRLSYCVLPDRITFRIEDEGQGFNPSKLTDPSINPQAHIQERRDSGKRMGGWGIFLTRKLMDEISYNAKGNVVFLTKYLRNKTNGLKQTQTAEEAEPDELKEQIKITEAMPLPPLPPSPPLAETTEEKVKIKKERPTRRFRKADFDSKA